MMFWLLDWSGYRDGGARQSPRILRIRILSVLQEDPRSPLDLVTSRNPFHKLGLETTCRPKLRYPQRPPASLSAVLAVAGLRLAET
jgi:hypothetical protein